MKQLMIIGVVGVVVFEMLLPLRVDAVSPSPVPEERSEKAARGIRVKGEIVCLFQSGTADVRKAITVGDILVVTRERGKEAVQEVGRIRVRAYVGEDYLSGEVLEGEVGNGDIAKKGNAATLVISSEERCR